MQIKGLLWMEWHQYRGYFIRALLVIGLETILAPLIIWIFGLGDSAVAWSVNIKSILATGLSFTEIAAMVTAVFLAALMLAGERGGSLNYLVTTPVSRREIIIAKFISGNLALVAIMAIISLFLVAAQTIQPAQYTVQEALGWAFITTATLICIFSLAFLVASLCQGILSSALISAFIMGLPWMLLTIAAQVTSKFYTFSFGIGLKLRHLATYCYIPDYISREGRYIQDFYGNVSIDRVNPDYPLEITLLLLASGFCLWLVIKVFDKNPLERRGEILIFGNFKQIFMIFISFLVAMLPSSEMASSPASYLLYFLVLWLGLYLFMYVGVWVIGWLARYGWGRD